MSQPLAALEEANRIRSGRAKVKAGIRSGQITIGDAILDHADVCRTMTVAQLLKAQNRWGNLAVSRCLNRTGISYTRRVGTLTDREKIALIKETS